MFMRMEETTLPATIDIKVVKRIENGQAVRKVIQTEINGIYRRDIAIRLRKANLRRVIGSDVHETKMEQDMPCEEVKGNRDFTNEGNLLGQENVTCRRAVTIKERRGVRLTVTKSVDVTVKESLTRLLITNGMVAVMAFKANGLPNP